MEHERDAESPEVDITRRDFLKAGAVCACAVLCGTMGKNLLFAADGKKTVTFKIVRGNKCKRCPKVLEDALKDKEFRNELSKCFKKGAAVNIAYGGKAKLKPENMNIAFGRCARNLTANVSVPGGCPPKKEQLLEAVKAAAESAKNHD